VQISVRSSGILLHLASLPNSPYCGNLGQGSRRFADFLEKSGQSWWQMLPINPIDKHHSPYASISSFAGEPLFIDLEHLAQEGLLDPDDVTWRPDGPTEQIAYAAASDYCEARLRKAFVRFKEEKGGNLFRVCREQFLDENNFWIQNHSVFCALADFFGTQDWPQWPDVALRRHQPEAVRNAFRDLADDIEYHTFLQLVFDVQWKFFRKYCQNKKIGLIGDVPIYVAAASADTWGNRHLFQLDEDGRLLRVAGVPGDSFNPEGQRWNAPLYRWEVHESEKYQWWLNRMKLTLQRFDTVRLDHFIGFHNYFSMPQEVNEEDKGRWFPGPGAEFFETIFKTFPNARLIAEDLGVLNEGVHHLREKFAFPGMNVLQFHFDYRHDGDPTRHWAENSIVCTGTHDTNTMMGWLHDVRHEVTQGNSPWDCEYMLQLFKHYIPRQAKDLSQEWQETEQSHAILISKHDAPLPTREQIHAALLRMVMSSPGNGAIFPMQDILGLGSEARMNFPGTSDGNWNWRLDDAYLTERLARSLRELTVEYDRLP